WLLPLLVTLKFTTNMRYETLGEPTSTCATRTPGQCYGDYLFPRYFFHPGGWEPYRWGAYILIGVAIVAAARALRRSTCPLAPIDVRTAPDHGVERPGVPVLELPRQPRVEPAVAVVLVHRPVPPHGGRRGGAHPRRGMGRRGGRPVVADARARHRQRRARGLR